MNVVVAGYVAPFPVAGFLWDSAASWLLGFRELGCDVFFLDDSGDAPWGWDFERGEEDPSCRSGSAFLARELGALGLGDRWCFRHIPTGRHDGTDESTLRDVLRDADVFVNVSCTTPMRPEYHRIPHRLAIDTDPVFTQIRIARGDPALAAVPETHTRLFTIGCPPLPAQQHEWVHTRQPVPLAHWPVAGPAPADAPFTTVMQWRAYPPAEWQGQEFGGKDRSFATFLDLPSVAPRGIELAMAGGDGHHDGLALLQDAGFALSDPWPATRSTEAYRQFIASSASEWSLAKHGYVAPRSGAFSERTLWYLASGRPAVVQDTGFSEWLPTGRGIVAFDDVAGSVRGMEAVLADPTGHARAARELVDEHFDARDVCGRILDEACG